MPALAATRIFLLLLVVDRTNGLSAHSIGRPLTVPSLAGRHAGRASARFQRGDGSLVAKGGESGELAPYPTTAVLAARTAKR